MEPNFFFGYDKKISEKYRAYEYTFYPGLYNTDV